MDRWFTETITPQTEAPGLTYPYDPVTTCGTPFKAAIDYKTSRQVQADGSLVTITVPILLYPTDVTLTSAMKLKYGTRTFEIDSWPNDNPLRPQHHAEVTLKEIK